VELALELIPHVVKVGLLVNVATETTIDRQEAETASQRVGIDLIPVEVRVPDDLDNVFKTLAKDNVQALIVLVDGMFFSERQRIAELRGQPRRVFPSRGWLRC
jgi:hypothetical protein